MGGRAVRTLLTVVVDILILLAIALVIREFLIYSGQVAHQGWARAYDALTSRLVIRFGFANIKTPYGGVFDVNDAFTVLLALVAEWGLSAVRDRA
ncbi:MAG TPA: hypothetical protein VIL41_05570 [Coriobacteriia bacterium]